MADCSRRARRPTSLLPARQRRRRERPGKPRVPGRRDAAALTKAGEAHLTALGIELSAVRRPRRVFARPCVDLTQRRPHLGGALGDALLDLYVDRGWIQRHPRSRAVTLTPAGRDGFRRWFGA